MESEVAHCKASKLDIKPNLTRFSSYKMFMLKKHSLTFNCYHVSELTLLTCCLLLLPLWDSVIVLCFVVRFSMSLLVLQSSGWGRESWFLA